MDSNQQDKEFVHPVHEEDNNLEQTAAERDVDQEQKNRKADLLEKEEQIPKLKYAGFWMRFWAYLLDILVIGSINRIVIYPILRAFDMPVNDPSMFAPVSIATAVIFYAYFVLMTKFFGQTLGKMVFGLKVIPLGDRKLNWSTIMFREWIGRFISGTILILYIVVGFLPKKQGIHDLFADTTVVHERS